MRLVTVIFALVMLSMFNSANADNLKLGDTAPSFELQDQTGVFHKSEQYHGQWLVLYFYPKDDTPGCTTEACAFRDEYKVIIEQNTQVIGISVDSVESHAEFAGKYNLPFPLLADKGGIVAKQYQSLASMGPIKFAKRHSFIIDPEGKIRKIYRSVSPSRHSQQIISDLAKLKSDKTL
jgi:peroxiredoxin Q/BCP